MTRRTACCLLVTLLLICGADAFAQGSGRVHRATQSDGFVPIPADRSPGAPDVVTVTVEGGRRVIRADGIPEHLVGAFPNAGNPNSIRVQSYVYQMPVTPRRGREPRPLGMNNFGVGVNGVPFDPGAAEWYLGKQSSGWQYEALSGAVTLGIDANNAHVQPTGAYHYHGLPTGLLSDLSLSPSVHSPLVGWAADGFPIYALYGYAPGSTDVRELRSSYRLREGTRPSGSGQPGGTYDGTFIEDYAFAEGSGDLDRCNGRQAVTPEYPDGTYAYFLTREWPVIPRCHVAAPDASFAKGPPNGGRHGPPPHGRRPPPPRR